MHSPATHFSHHIRAIQNLITTAHAQSKRFFEYLASQPEAPLYERRDGEYIEVHRLSLSSFRSAFPIGLTVESFSPFAAMCKELPSITPLLGQHAFLSMSIDDLFVLNRFLPTTGELFHYLEVRQQVALLRGAQLFDEVDHLGAYVVKNRFDLDLRAALNKADRVTWDRFSAVVDEYFSGDRWLTEPRPRQSFPVLVERLLELLGESRNAGWLAADATIRDLDDSERQILANRIRALLDSLTDRPHRWFVTGGGRVRTLLMSFSRDDRPVEGATLIRLAEVAAVATKRPETYVICASATQSGKLKAVRTLRVMEPERTRIDYPAIAKEASALMTNMIDVRSSDPRRGSGAAKIGRNDSCWCGSDLKYKRCHGR